MKACLEAQGIRACCFGCFKVSQSQLGTVELYRSSHGTDFDGPYFRSP